ncbi:thioredoxin family Trp26 [Pseudohyphozyma bogoriensis]|nr:thioredoxin family Trp26 [Pseudohyphozyma bogoriensis]
MNCQDELTEVDIENPSGPNHIASASTSSTVSLYPFIFHTQSTGINLEDPTYLPRLLRPHDSKDVVKSNDELVGEDEQTSGVWGGGCIDSQEGDDEVIIRVRFTELVRIKSVLIGTGGGQAPFSPRNVKIWVNRATGIEFNDVESIKPEQEFELLEGVTGDRGAVEYPVRMVRFANVSSVDFFFSNTRSSTHSRLFYLGFMGESRQLKKEPNDRLTVGAETGVEKHIDGVKEEARGAHAVK